MEQLRSVLRSLSANSSKFCKCFVRYVSVTNYPGKESFLSDHLNFQIQTALPPCLNHSSILGVVNDKVFMTRNIVPTVISLYSFCELRLAIHFNRTQCFLVFFSFFSFFSGFLFFCRLSLSTRFCFMPFFTFNHFIV